MKANLWILTIALVVVTGCGPSAPTVLPPAARASAAPSASAEPASGYFPSRRFGLELPLADGDAWKIDDTRTPWLEASEKSTTSSLLLRFWRDDNRMTRDRCEERARDWKKLPAREGANIVTHESWPSPTPDFDTAIDVGLVPDPAHGGLFGFVLAFGGYAHRCFAFVYVTRGVGPDSDREVGARLAKIVEGTLKKIRFVSELQPEIDHHPDPSTP